MATMRIKTKIDNSEVDEGLKKLQNKLDESARDVNTSTKEYERQKDILDRQNETLSQQERKYEAIQKKIKDANNELNKLISSGDSRTPRAQELSSNIGNLNVQKNDLGVKIDKTLAGIQKQEVAVQKASDKVNKYRNTWSEAKAEVEKTTQELEEQNRKDLFSKISQNINNVGQDMEKMVKKAGKWALALFGIRGIISLITGAVNTLSNENGQIALDLEYMKWVLAQSLKPVIEWLISGLYKVMALINIISKALFGINLFSGKSAEDFKSMKKNSEATASNLKEAKKQITGFDEMNTVQDTSASSSGNSSSGFGSGLDSWNMPDLDEEEKKVKGYMNAWDKFGKEMHDIIYNTSFSDWLDAFGNFGIAVAGITTLVYGLWEFVSGFFQFIGGAVELLVGLITGNTEMVKKGLFDLIDGLWKMIDGFLHFIGGVFGTIVGIIAGAVLEVIDALSEIWDFLKWLFEIIGNAIGDFISNTIDWFGGLDDKIRDGIAKFNSWLETFFQNLAKSIGDWLSNRGKDIKNGINNFNKWLDEKISNIKNCIIDTISTAVEFVLSIPSKIKQTFNSLFGFFTGLWNKITSSFKSFGEMAGNSVKGAFVSVINSLLGTTENILNTPIKSINSLIGKINSIPGINLGKLSTISLPRIKMAVGGIVNQPGAGVPIGGEAGREGVLPLTNHAVMEELGETIGRHVTIDVTTITKLDSRTIARETKRVNTNDSFLLNN